MHITLRNEQERFAQINIQKGETYRVQRKVMILQDLLVSILNWWLYESHAKKRTSNESMKVILIWQILVLLLLQL